MPAEYPATMALAAQISPHLLEKRQRNQTIAKSPSIVDIRMSPRLKTLKDCKSSESLFGISPTKKTTHDLGAGRERIRIGPKPTKLP